MVKTEKAARARNHAALPPEIDCAVRAADAKKASDIVVLDLRGSPAFTDYFVICSAQNARQIRAVADAVLEALEARGVEPAHVEGYDRSEWVLIDYFDFVVHVFLPDTRLFYGLERLWGNAESVPLSTG